MSKGQRRGGVAVIPSHPLRTDTGLMGVNVCVHVYHCDSKMCVLVMTKEWLYCVSVAGPVANAVRK